MSAPLEQQIKVLLIEDDPKLGRLLRGGLEEQGYSVLEVPTAMEGVEAARHCRPDAVLLDIDVACGGGMSALKSLREWSRVPVLVISVRNDESAKIAALDEGANDFLAWPISTAELLARLRAALRTAAVQPVPDVFRTGALSVDFTTRTVRVGRRIVRLTATEFSLLRLFVRNAGRVVTHAQILSEIWGPKMVDKLDYLRVYLAYLRKKLEHNPGEPELLLTEPLVGYRLAVRKYRT